MSNEVYKFTVNGSRLGWGYGLCCRPILDLVEPDDRPGADLEDALAGAPL